MLYSICVLCRLICIVCIYICILVIVSLCCAVPYRIGDQCECNIGDSGSMSLTCLYVQLHHCTNMQNLIHYTHDMSSSIYCHLYFCTCAVLDPMEKCVQAPMQGSVYVDSAYVDRMSTHRSAYSSCVMSSSSVNFL